MKIGFNKNTTELFEVGNESNNVTVDDTVNIDAIEVLVEMYNSDYSNNRIKSNLEADERLTGDEVDHLMGAIDVLEEMESAPRGIIEPEMIGINSDAPWTEEVTGFPTAKESTVMRIGDDNICPITNKPCDDETCSPGAECNISGDSFEGDILEPKDKQTEKLKQEMMDTIDEQIKKGKEEFNTPITPEKKERKKKREPRTISSSIGTSSKSISPQEYVKILQEKMDLTLLVDGVLNIPEIPEGVSKKGRELLLDMGKELNGVVEKYLEAIQTM